ncbi:UDP-glucuronosyltransferase 2C1-like [Branchiostoma lanceolatum]|uniref:UDP-glucuronosyltransferase 2C1-like n=1 Tax=Branchiostoma lanceolatum TaxID=7740 RepID=UPI003453AC29
MASTPKLQCSGILLILLGLTNIHWSNEEKILLVPMPMLNSHWMVEAAMGQALVDRGHVVTAVVEKDIVDKRRAERPDFMFETFQDHGVGKRLREFQDQVFVMARPMSITEKHQVLPYLYESQKEHCNHLLDDEMLGNLKRANYSVVISDPFFLCGTILAANISVPYVAIRSAGGIALDKMTAATGLPLPLAYVPSILLDFTDQMTFLQRVGNVLTFGFSSISRQWVETGVFDYLSSKCLSQKDTIQSLMSSTDLWLSQTDNVLDFPRPSMPNTVQVGGLTVRTGVPLSEDLEGFMQSSSDDGVVIVSFGSMIGTMSTEKKEIFAAAFAQLRQKVVWRYVGERPTGVGNNTRLMSWLPQNDLLAHPKTRAFVTHAGLNGVYEALYHGVPMVCLPQFLDTPGIAARVVARGLGVKLDLMTVTSDELSRAVTHVLTNNSYRKTAARLSRLYRDQPQSPMERAAWWIEHVIKHGGLPHLRARAVDLPFYQYYLLDVAACLLAVCSAVLGTVWCSCLLVCSKIYCKTGGKLKSL